MTAGFDRIGIAARIRGLLAGQFGEDPSVAAAHLNVDETGLRMSIDTLAPNPTIDVVAAIVAAYGVDPAWLLTGEYDPALHRNILSEQESANNAISRLMAPLPSARSSGSHLRLMRAD